MPKAAQIARYSPDGKLLVVSSLNSNMLSLIEISSGKQAAVPVGSQPMDFTFRGDDIFVGCQGDGTIHVVDMPKRQHKLSFPAGKGCESVGFFLLKTVMHREACHRAGGVSGHRSRSPTPAISRDVRVYWIVRLRGRWTILR